MLGTQSCGSTTCPSSPVQGPYHGYEGLRQWAEDITEVAHDFRTEVERITEVDDRRVVALLRSRGRAAHTGIEIEVAWGAVYTLREGKVAHAQGYRSHQQALEAAGL